MKNLRNQIIFNYILATLAIPNPEIEPLEEVHFIEPKADFLQQAVDLVQRYNEEARPWLQNQQRSKRRRGYVQQNENRSQNKYYYFFLKFRIFQFTIQQYTRIITSKLVGLDV